MGKGLILAYYSFSIKKGSLSIELESADSELIAQEIEKWFGDILGLPSNKPVKSKKVPNSKTLDKKQSTVKEQEVIEEIQKPVEDLKVIVQSEDPKPVIIEVEESKEKEIVIESIEIDDSKSKVAIQDLIDEDLDSADIDKIKALEEAINKLSKKIKQVKKEEILVEPVQAVQNKIEEKKELIEDNKAVLVGEEVPAEDYTSTNNDKFFNILQEKVSSLPEKVGKVISNLSSEAFSEPAPESGTIGELISQKNPQSPIDYLLITSYYLKENEKLDRYSLKQINSKIITFTKQLIDHSIIQNAVSQGYFEVVPDFTGMSGVTEYRITDEGEIYVLNEL